MTALAWTIPIAFLLGGLGLAGFLWSLKTGQYDDLEGASWRALDDEPPAAIRSNPSPLAGEVKRGLNNSGRGSHHP